MINNKIGRGSTTSPVRPAVGITSPASSAKKEVAWAHDPTISFPMVWLRNNDGKFSVKLYFHHAMSNQNAWQRNNQDWFFDNHKPDLSEWRLKDFSSLELRVKPGRDLYLGIEPTNVDLRKHRFNKFKAAWENTNEGQSDKDSERLAKSLRDQFDISGNPIAVPLRKTSATGDQQEGESRPTTPDLPTDDSDADEDSKEVLIASLKRKLEEQEARLTAIPSSQNMGPSSSSTILLQSAAVTLETISDGGANLERFRHQVMGARSGMNSLDRNKFISLEVKDAIMRAFRAYSGSASTKNAKDLIDGWEHHENWDDTKFFDVMRGVFRTKDAKECYTAKDFGQYLDNAPAKNFFFTTAIAGITMVVSALISAAKTMGVNFPPDKDDEQAHKTYIKKTMARMKTATRSSEDSQLAATVISLSNPDNKLVNYEAFGDAILATHIDGVQTLEKAKQFGACYPPNDKGGKLPGQKDHPRPSDPDGDKSKRDEKRRRIEKEKEERRK